MKKSYMIALIFILLLVIVYFVGPKLVVNQPDTALPVMPVGIDSISRYIQEQEAAFPVKPGNESMILWGGPWLSLPNMSCFICMVLLPAVMRLIR